MSVTQRPEATRGRGLLLLVAGLAAGVLLACCAVTAGLGLVVFLGGVPSLAGSRGRPPNDTPEAFIQDRNRLLNDLVDLLGGVQDQASARRAVVKLRADLGPRIQQLKRREQVLGTITPDQQQLLEVKHGAETQTAKIRLGLELQRVKDVPGGRDVIQELREQFKGWSVMQLLLDFAG
jgi:ABC-type transport system involved in cytochrome bd biosynthesis fused ATPase/permease subunit